MFILGEKEIKFFRECEGTTHTQKFSFNVRNQKIVY